MVKLRERTTKNLENKAGARVSLNWLRAINLPSKICLIVLLLIVLISIFAPVLAPMSPYDIF